MKIPIQKINTILYACLGALIVLLVVVLGFLDSLVAVSLYLGISLLFLSPLILLFGSIELYRAARRSSTSDPPEASVYKARRLARLVFLISIMTYVANLVIGNVFSSGPQMSFSFIDAMFVTTMFVSFFVAVTAGIVWAGLSLVAWSNTIAGRDK